MPRSWLIAGAAIALVLVYWLGSHDQGLSAAQAIHDRNVKLEIKAGQRSRAFSDSLENMERASLVVATSLRLEARVLQAELDRSSLRIDSTEVVSLNQDIADLLPGLSLAAEAGRYWTDSVGVRHLEGMRIRSLRAELVPMLQRTVDLERTRADTLEQAAIWASTRADSSDSRSIRLEELLKEGQKLHRCRVAILLPCPSRATSFFVGAAIGVVLMVFASQ